MRTEARQALIGLVDVKLEVAATLIVMMCHRVVISSFCFFDLTLLLTDFSLYFQLGLCKSNSTLTLKYINMDLVLLLNKGITDLSSCQVVQLW